MYFFPQKGRVNLASGQNLDYETTDLYEIEVLVEDTGVNPGALTATVTCYVTVTDVNEHDPDFSSAPSTISVPESTAIGNKIIYVYNICL